LRTSGDGAVVALGATDVISRAAIAASSLLEVSSATTLLLSSGSLGSRALIETLSGGTAVVTGTITNGGTLFASGAGSLVEIASGTVVSGGVAEVGDGNVEIGGSSSENVASSQTAAAGSCSMG
jgi:hypothetical protein